MLITAILIVGMMIAMPKEVVLSPVGIPPGAFKEAKAQGPAVYTPYGGFDTIYPYLLAEDVIEVYSTGLENFGSPNDVEKDLAGLLGPEKKKRPAYDESRYLKSLHGPGALAIQKIVKNGGTPLGIYYFDIGEDGSRNFLSNKEIQERQAQGGSFKNAVVSFRNAEGKTKIFCYAQTDVTKENPAFLKYLGKLKVQTVFLKAAAPLSLFNGMTQKEIREIKQRTLRPIKANNPSARVVTDRIFFDNCSYPIWQKGYTPEKFLLGYPCGYCSAKDYMYSGPISAMMLKENMNTNHLQSRSNRLKINLFLRRKISQLFLRETGEVRWRSPAKVPRALILPERTLPNLI